MTRFAALLSAILLCAAAPATAATVTFAPKGGSITFACTPTGGSRSCGLAAPEFEFDNDKDDVTASPVATFRFLEFEAADSSDDNNDDDEGPRGRKDAASERTTGTFTTTVKLLLGIGKTSSKVTVEGTGSGGFTTQDGEIRIFSIAWKPIPGFVIDGIGPFAIAFGDIDTAARKGDLEDLYITATITPVPLPAGAVLLLSGIALIGATRLRGRTKA